ncbi:MAG: hypothetical protein PHF60_00275 [Candidatus ainarchaeum sp.]|nr:hypothetical protein [Candidatus ainarchaeum sp.]
MPGESQAKREKLLDMYTQSKPPAEAIAPPVQAPKQIDLSRLRPTVRREVEAGVTRQSEAAMKVAAIFVQTAGSFMKASRRIEDEMGGADSQILRFYKTTQANPEDIFKDCKVQYAYNQRQKIYSISAMLEGRPRIITIRVGDNFTELSLADQKNNNKILEVLRQDDGKGVTFSKIG